MKDTVFIPPRSDSSARTVSESGALTGIPPDLVAKIIPRLGWAGLTYAVVYLLSFFPMYFFHLMGGMGWTQADPTSLIIASVSVVTGLAVWIVVRSRRVDVVHVVYLGLVFEVVGSIGISAAEFWELFPAISKLFPRLENIEPFLGGISWVCVWVILFPFMVPTNLRNTVVASLLSASMGPVVVLFSWAAHGRPPGAEAFGSSVHVLYNMFFANYLCVGLAVVYSRIIYQLGRAVSAARQMGSYRLVERLGQGGMGEVWRAEHNLLARPAAIKFIRPEALGKGNIVNLTQRFELEAQTIAGLTSPHTIVLYDFGVSEGHTFYYVMELLEGLDLDTLVEAHGPLPAPRVVFLLLQACHSLQEAHEAGLIHRDIKPANLYITRRGLDYDFVKVLDFGLVKRDRDTDDDPRLTREGSATGTPLTMAPEVALGRTVDHRADIYSLGCTAYWMLTGSNVFQARSALEMVAHHVNTVPDPPSSRTEVAVPQKLEAIILRCLEKDPGRRPANMGELAADLHECGVDGAWMPEHAREWWSLHAPAAE